jgi:hydrogenase nickel incorporation protein HypB
MIMTKKISINTSLKAQNDLIAAANRNLFQDKNLKVYNLIGSPGCGKTSLLEATAAILKDRLAVIEGDVKTTQDADRILRAGSQAVQIQTGGACHLNAEMVQKALPDINFDGVDVLVIENVGNLVCPSTFDLGENAKVAVLSLPEGDEKPVKYPALFTRAGLVLINKIDLKPVMDYSIERVKSDCLKLKSDVKIIEISAKTLEGVGAWIKYLLGTS